MKNTENLLNLEDLYMSNIFDFSKSINISFCLTLNRWPKSWCDLFSIKSSDKENSLTIRIKSDRIIQIFYGDGIRVSKVLSVPILENVHLKSIHRFAITRDIIDAGKQPKVITKIVLDNKRFPLSVNNEIMPFKFETPNSSNLKVLDDITIGTINPLEVHFKNGAYFKFEDALLSCNTEPIEALDETAINPDEIYNYQNAQDSKIFIKKSFKESKFVENEISNALEILTVNDEIPFIRKIVTKEGFRPKLLSDRYKILALIYSKKKLPLYLRLYALIASAHKSIEAMDSSFVLEAQTELDKTHNLIQYLSFSDDLRTDRTHCKFSHLSVCLHIAIWRKEFNKFHYYSSLSLEDFKDLDKPEITKLFYQTSTNVSRCIGFHIISILMLNSDRNHILNLISESAHSIRDALSMGLNVADFNLVKGREFIRDFRIFNASCELIDSIEQEADIKNKAFQLFSFCLRPKNAEGQQYMKNVFKNSIQPRISLK